jgi:nucleotide-binding universal stress UspA family protein
MVLQPVVLGPDNVPEVTDPERAAADVPFAVLSALTHSTQPSADAILKAVAAALDTIDLDTAKLFAEFTEVGLGDTPARTTWRKLMATYTYRYPSQLRLEGREEGRAEALAQAVLRVLDRRGLQVTDTHRHRITTCTDPAQLEAWLDHALTADNTDELFT